MDELTSTEGLVALGAGAVAVIALLFAIVLAFRIRGIRKAQSAVIGGTDRGDLVAHAERLETGFRDLRDWVEESLESIERRMAGAEARVDGCLAYRALIRYDAYGEMSGQQSSSVALLDSHRSGVVVSTILHRDQARVYVKELQQGESEHDLSPEERQAIEAALAPARA
jgi:hypothetical protein